MNVIVDNTTPPTAPPTKPAPPSGGAGAGSSTGRLPRWAPWLAIAIAAAIGLLSWVFWLGPVQSSLLAVVLYLVGMPLWSGLVEGRRAATDRLVTGLVWSSFAVACVPLVWLLVTVVQKGHGVISGEFLSASMFNVFKADQTQGLYHALMGTVLVTLMAAVISVPIGIFTAIYLVEYAKGTKMARTVTFLVDVMTGIPSIVAGLFALALFTLILGPGIQFGFGASVALSLLMIPTVLRTTEEMLRLVPADLREASYALGVPKWRTIVKVVLPTAFGGIVTGVVLAISRVIGETAPIMVIAGFTAGMNTNLFSDQMMTLPVFIYDQYTKGEDWNVANAWGGALVLIVLVMVLNLLARIIGKIFAPKTGR